MKKRKVRFLSIRQKFMIIAAICIVLVSIGIGYISYNTMENQILTMAADKALVVGVMTGKQIDKNVLARFGPGDERLTMYVLVSVI